MVTDPCGTLLTCPTWLREDGMGVTSIVICQVCSMLGNSIYDHKEIKHLILSTVLT